MSTPPAYSYWFPDPAHPPVAHGPASSPGSEAPGSGAPKAGAPKSGAPQSGTPHGLVWPHGFALLDAAIAPDVADALWLHAPATLGEFIDTLRTLTAAPIPGPTSFAVAFGQGGDWRLAVNGSARASVGREDDVVVIESDGSRWAERQLDKVVRLGLSMGEHAVTAGASGRPIVAGVVPSMAVLRVMQVASYAVDALDASVAYAPAPDPSHPVATPDPSTPIATPDPSTPIATPDPSHPVATPAAALSEQPTPAPESTGGPAIPASFGHLWGNTILGTPDLARGATPSGPHPATPHPQAPNPATPNPQAPNPATPNPKAPHPPTPNGPDANQWGDHDGHTVLGPDPAQSSPRPSVAAPAASPQGLVLARRCIRGHDNPPDRSLCRSCGDRLVAPPTQVPQPVIGRAVLNSGQEIRLSGPVILGREPEAKRVTDGPLPTLVPLPRNHISRNHVRLLVEGWQAFAADLHSKNGTVLYRRGHPPVRLTERPAQLSQGDVLDFGHGVILTIEELP